MEDRNAISGLESLLLHPQLPGQPACLELGRIGSDIGLESQLPHHI